MGKIKRMIGVKAAPIPIMESAALKIDWYGRSNSTPESPGRINSG
jgi:hypothetical protein